MEETDGDRTDRFQRQNWDKKKKKEMDKSGGFSIQK